MGLPLMRRGTQCGSADSATQSIVQTRRITRLCYRFITETAAEIYCCEAAGICIAPPGRRSVSRAALRREIFVILALFALVRVGIVGDRALRSEEHTSELQSLMRISYAVFCLKKKNKIQNNNCTNN